MADILLRLLPEVLLLLVLVVLVLLDVLVPVVLVVLVVLNPVLVEGMMVLSLSKDDVVVVVVQLVGRLILELCVVVQLPEAQSVPTVLGLVVGAGVFGIGLMVGVGDLSLLLLLNIFPDRPFSLFIEVVVSLVLLLLLLWQLSLLQFLFTLLPLSVTISEVKVHAVFLACEVMGLKVLAIVDGQEMSYPAEDFVLLSKKPGVSPSAGRGLALKSESARATVSAILESRLGLEIALVKSG